MPAQECPRCQRITEHRELTEDPGTQVPGRTVLVCDMCGTVTTTPPLVTRPDAVGGADGS
jgi:hypothetical protein